MGKKPRAGLQAIPGVGPDMEQHLNGLDIFTLEQLKGQDPEALYCRDCALHGQPLDRCLLYVYRLAVYYAGHDTHQPEKLNWWYWKDTV